MLYVIYGSDQLGRRETFAKLKAELDTDGSLATNHVTFDAKTASPQEAMAACDAMPFLGDRRLVVIEGLLKQGTRIKKAAKRGAKAKAPEPEPEPGEEEEEDAGRWAVLAEYVPRMPKTTTLVVLDDEVAAANVLLKAIGPLGKVEHCTLPDERNGLAPWITARAKKMGLKLDAPAAKALANLIGPDPLTLASEMSKLLAYSNGGVVREADVRELVSRAKEHKGWELADAVLEGQGAKAARVLYECLEDGQAAAVLLSTIAGRYRRIAIVRDMLARGEPGTVIARRLEMKMGYGLDKLIDQAQRTHTKAIRAAYARLIQAELDLKRGMTGGLMDDRLALELAVQELASRPAAAAAR
ncbi:MAG: DNA polymerase III subunit delta [Chloroflexota bacterium]